MTRQRAFRSNASVRNHARPRSPILPANPALDDRLLELLSPTLVRLGASLGRYNVRQRIIRLPVMIGLVLAMVWRQVESVRSLVGLLERERLLGEDPVRISQQAVAQRLKTFPAAVFAELFAELVPIFQARAVLRTRPLPPVVARARTHFEAILAADGTTLEELFKKTDALRDRAGTVLAGRLLALVDVVSKQPLAILRQVESTANDHGFLPELLHSLRAGTLLLLDAGFYDFAFFRTLTDRNVAFIARAKKNLAVQVIETFQSGAVRDAIVEIGLNGPKAARQRVRLVEIQVVGGLRRYLTNVLDPRVLPAADIVELYARRWRVEEAFLVVKRLLGLSYVWTGHENGILLQIWGTWLLYAVLLDLCDAIAQELDLPLDRISIEIVYRSLPYYCDALARGEATDIAAYFAAPAQVRLGIVKSIRSPRRPPSTVNSHAPP